MFSPQAHTHRQTASQFPWLLGHKEVMFLITTRQAGSTSQNKNKKAWIKSLEIPGQTPLPDWSKVHHSVLPCATQYNMKLEIKPLEWLDKVERRDIQTLGIWYPAERTLTKTLWKVYLIQWAHKTGVLYRAKDRNRVVVTKGNKVGYILLYIYSWIAVRVCREPPIGTYRW